jgi:predicted HTH transcriptional regulator
MDSFFVNGRGANKLEEYKANAEKIREWIEKNPGKTKGECCAALGITYATLRRHIADMAARESK